MDEGSVLKARRVRLGKDEMWIEKILSEVFLAGCANNGRHGYERRVHAERPGQGDICYTDVATEALWAAYAEALDVAERTQGEPLCPKGVVRGDAPGHVDDSTLFGDYGKGWQVRVDRNGTITLLPQEVGWTSRQVSPALLTYVADLSVWRAEGHAAAERQRALTEVRAAEDAYQAAEDAYQAAHDAYARAEDAMTEAASALRIAREKAAC